MNELRHHLMRWGMVAGALVYPPLQAVVSALFDAMTWPEVNPVMIMRDALAYLQMNGLLWAIPGAIGGGITGGMARGWLEGDAERIRRAGLGAACFVAMGLWWLLDGTVRTGRMGIVALPRNFGPAFVPWQVRLAFWLLGPSLFWQWNFVLCVVAKIARNRLAREPKRAQQFAAPGDSPLI